MKYLEVFIKVVLSFLLFICLFDMPYGYYQFVRFLAFVIFLLLAYWAYDKRNLFETIIYICLALLFQPFLKIALGRQIWNIIDVIVGIYLVISIFINIYGVKKKV